MMTTDDTGTRAEAKDVSERTCVGCRQLAPRAELVRFAIRVDAGVASVVPDVAHKLGGRGASVHPSAACIESAVKRGGFAKAASARVDASAAELIAMLDGQLVQRARGLLLGAIRAKLAVLGADGTEKAITERRVVALVLAGDAAARTGSVAASIARLGGRAIQMLTKAELGALVGRDEVAVIGIGDEGIAGALAQVAEQLRAVRGQDSDGNSDDPDGERVRARPEAG
jgi:predicted RNA-binding protein YlxR (DUF448 family)